MCNKCPKFIKWLMYVVATWLLARCALPVAESPERAQPDWTRLTYTKLPDAVVDALRDLIRGKQATPATAWLLMTIARRLNRKTNRVELTLVDLMSATGMSRDTILKHTTILEAAGLVTVDRQQVAPTRNGVNVYHLAGAALTALLSPNFDLQSSHLPGESSEQTHGVQKSDRKTTQVIPQQDTPAAAVLSSPEPALENAGEGRDIAGDSHDGDPRIDTLVAAGVERYKAREIAHRYDMTRIEAVVARSQQGNIRAPGAFVVKALERGWLWQDRQPAAAPDYARYAGDEETVDVSLPDFETQSDVQPATAELPPLPGWATETWRTALGQMRLQWERAAFDRYLRDTHLADVHLVDVGRYTFVFAVVDAVAGDALMGRLYRSVQRTLADVLGVPAEGVALDVLEVRHA